MAAYDRSYDKARRLPLGMGYDLRPDGHFPSSLVIHATHGAPGSLFVNEAKFLRDSPDVSAHFLVGKAGRITQILSPTKRAWHAGVALPGYSNADSIGIELHAAVNEAITDPQRAALTSLVRDLMDVYSIPVERIATHRAIAIPHGRKSDPATWNEADFASWRASLTPATPAPLTADSAILAPPRAALQQCIAAILAHPHGGYTAQDVGHIVTAYYAVCASVGVDPLVAIAQMLHEADWLSSFWSQRPQRNPAGLGVTGEWLGMHPDTPPGTADWAYNTQRQRWERGLSFRSWANDAIPAHIGRLLSYALAGNALTTLAQQDLITVAHSFRPFPPAYRGTAPTLAGLDGRWAVPGVGYGAKLAAVANGIAGRSLL